MPHAWRRRENNVIAGRGAGRNCPRRRLVPAAGPETSPSRGEQGWLAVGRTKQTEIAPSVRETQRPAGELAGDDCVLTTAPRRRVVGTLGLVNWALSRVGLSAIFEATILSVSPLAGPPVSISNGITSPLTVW